jgi:hypothetical protein
MVSFPLVTCPGLGAAAPWGVTCGLQFKNYLFAPLREIEIFSRHAFILNFAVRMVFECLSNSILSVYVHAA